MNLKQASGGSQIVPSKEEATPAQRLDLNAMGKHDSRDIIDLDLERDFADRPWRKPGKSESSIPNHPHGICQTPSPLSHQTPSH